jgi:hypothetical protein
MYPVSIRVSPISRRDYLTGMKLIPRTFLAYELSIFIVTPQYLYIVAASFMNNEAIQSIGLDIYVVVT